MGSADTDVCSSVVEHQLRSETADREMEACSGTNRVGAVDNYVAQRSACAGDRLKHLDGFTFRVCVTVVEVCETDGLCEPWRGEAVCAVLFDLDSG